MKVLTLLNEKGGIGKSTSVTTIAPLLAEKGYKVVVVDTDTQGHVAKRLKMRVEDGFGALMNGADWQDVLRPVNPAYYGGAEGQTNLWIVPTDAASFGIDSTITASYLIERLEELRGAVDFVLFDTSPRLGNIHTALYAASDYIIIPTECTRLSVEGVISTINHIQKSAIVAQKHGLSTAQILGILPTKFNGTKKVHYQNLGWIEGRYGEKISMFSPIRFLTDWEKAEALQIPVYMYNPRSDAAKDARGLVDEILARLGATTHG